MIKARVRHGLINNKIVVLFRAETKKMDQIRVPKLWQKIDFIKKFSVISSYLDNYFLSGLKLTLKIFKILNTFFLTTTHVFIILI